MPTRISTKQITFRYRTVDSATGVTRKTAKRLPLKPHSALRLLVIRVERPVSSGN